MVPITISIFSVSPIEIPFRLMLLGYLLNSEKLYRKIFPSDNY